jgi:hypothetical protein
MIEDKLLMNVLTYEEDQMDNHLHYNEEYYIKPIRILINLIKQDFLENIFLFTQLTCVIFNCGNQFCACSIQDEIK